VNVLLTADGIGCLAVAATVLPSLVGSGQLPAAGGPRDGELR
jgi:hypothetical protein